MTEPRHDPAIARSREVGAEEAARGGRPAAVIEVDIHVARDGTWYHEGTPVRRHALVKLFASALRREADGTYWLVTPAERARITVEDAPFVAVDVEAEGEGRDQRLVFATNVGDRVAAGADHPLRVEIRAGQPAPYLTVRERLDALIARPVYYRLVDGAVEETRDGRRVLGVWSEGRFFGLGDA